MMLFLAILFGGLILYALYQAVVPFLESRDEQLRFELLDREIEQIETLSARKKAILQTLKDIEFDFETGKISEADYERLRRRHERKALKVMRRLDELREGDDDMLDGIDEEIARRLEKLKDNTSRDASDDSASMTARPLRCPECDRQLEADARFCDRCGTEISEDVRTQQQHRPRTPADVPEEGTDSGSENDDLGIDVY